MAGKDESTLRLDDLEARVAKLAARPPAPERVCLRCGSDTEPNLKIRPSDPQHRVYHCPRCVWDFEI